jgi:5-methylcytosine-specific restriction endonuclease McrA
MLQLIVLSLTVREVGAVASSRCRSIFKACWKHGPWQPPPKGCPECERERTLQRGSTTARGLGSDHQKRRAALIASGDTLCWLCNRHGSWDDVDDPLTADHVVPRSNGGRYSELRPAHRSCNSRRGDKRGNDAMTRRCTWRGLSFGCNELRGGGADVRTGRDPLPTRDEKNGASLGNKRNPNQG